MRKSYDCLRQPPFAAFVSGASLLIGLLLALCTTAQTNPEQGLPFITNYSVKTYKASPQNWSIMEADNGLMYFGNSYSLLEYDGVKWRRVSDDIVRTMAKDSRGRIYYGASSDFGYLEPDSLGQTRPRSLLPQVPARLRNFNDVWSIYATGEGIYFQARERIFRLRPLAGGRWEIKTWDPQTKFMYAFYLDGTYYVHEQGRGLLKLQNDALTLIPGSEVLGNERTQVMLPYPGPMGERSYLIGQFYSGLYLYDGKTFRRFLTDADPYFLNNTLYKGTVLKDGTYALATTGAGLVIMDNRGKMRQHINREVGLQNESVYGVYSDSKGFLWLGLDNGISRIETASPFTQFAIESGITSAPLAVVRYGGNLYLGSANGLMSFNKASARFEFIEKVPHTQIFSLWPDGNALLVPSDGFYGVRGGKVQEIMKSRGGDLQIQTLFISPQYPNLLFATLAGGFGIFTRKPGTDGWQYAGRLPQVNENTWTIADGKAGAIWVGGQSQGVTRLFPYLDGAGNFVLEKTKVEQFDSSRGLSAGMVSVMEAGGVTYFATNKGLYRFEEGTKRFVPDKTFGALNFGDDVSEYAMTTDARGRIWITMEKEITLATPRPGGGYTLEKVPFLPIADRSIAWIYPEANGITWICTPEGLVRYDESRAKNYDQPFKTVLRQVVGGKEHLNALAVAGVGKEPRLSYNRNTLRFDFAAPFYEQEDKMQYQTWLEGFEPGWSEWDENHFKEYTNLSNGDYRFHVRAKNVYQKVSEEAVYGFGVLPPWFRTWWAYALYVLAGAGIVYTIVRYRTHQLHQKHRELERTVDERTAELSQRVAELEVINIVQEGLVREMDIKAIYELMGDKIRDVFDAQTVVIATFNHETGMEEFKYLIEKGVRYHPEPRPLDGLRRHLIQTRQKILVNEHITEAFKEFGLRVVPGTDMPKSALYVPLVLGDKITSYVSLQNLDREHAFSTSDVRLLETLANSMSVALENARLFDEIKLLLAETEKGKRNVELLSEIGKQITASLDFETIFYKLYEHINQLADATVFGIGLYDADQQVIDYKFAVEKGKRYAPYTRDTKDKNQFPVWCIENRKPVFINDVTKEYSRYITAFKEKELLLEDGSIAEDPQSLIYLPLMVQERVLGIITIQSFQKNAYSEYHLNLLQNLATYTSIALDNANAYRQLNVREQEIGRRVAELSTVNSISQALASQLNLKDLIQLVGDQMRQLFKANIVYLAMLDKKSRTITFPYQFGDNLQPIQLGEGLTSRILQSGEPLLINREVKAKTEELGIERIGIPAASYLGVPIPVGDEVIGVLSVQSTVEENRFDQRDQGLLSSIAASVGVAIRKAKLFEEVKQARQEAEAARKTAEQANEAKSAFLSTVSHELRTPLTSVLGFAKIIKKRLEDKIFPLTDQSDPRTAKTIQQVSENLTVVVAEGERLTHLINDVLDLAKIEAGKMEWNMETVSITEVIERAIAATTALFYQKNIPLEREFEMDLPDITGDRDKLIQVVVNLLSNAVKFTEKGSVTCRAFTRDGEVVVSVADTGIGIAPQDHAAVFEQFKQVGDTLTDKPKGTGLGLPISKEIIEHHGGHIWLESEVGKGSTFSFSIPIIRNGAAKPLQLDVLVRKLKEQMAQSHFNIKGGSATILIVDDEEAIRSLLRQELTEAGYLVEEASNGRQALESVRTNRPDLIILDVMMPEINGFDVAAILKNDPQTMDIPIIVLSIVQDKARGYRIGVDRYLTKPIDTNLLFSEVGHLLEQGKSKKKVMVVDEDSVTANTLADVLEAQGYQVVESDGKELVKKAIATQPDIIILNSVLDAKEEAVQTLRFEKGLENVLFLIYQNTSVANTELKKDL